MKKIVFVAVCLFSGTAAFAQHKRHDMAHPNHIGGGIMKTIGGEGWMYHVHYLRFLRGTGDKLGVGLGFVGMTDHEQKGISLPLVYKLTPKLHVGADPMYLKHHDEWELGAGLNVHYHIPVGPIHVSPTVGYMIGHENHLMAGLHVGLGF
ncbi:MAG: hypothetical protein JNN12_00935 [Bacteroidetes Order II. Incertae sedis bacterium]|nr:hypothetical protein [Bacteroidetes Order II. bacterium]